MDLAGRWTWMLAFLIAPMAFCATPDAGDQKPAADEWAIENPRQLTFRDQFTRAGEQYVSPDGRWIIFQATPVPPPGFDPSPHYQMYVAPLERDNDNRIIAMGDIMRVSKRGSANTCGWFHPKYPWVVLFGSTIEPPSVENQPGYQRGSGRYRWEFPAEMNIVTRSIDSIYRQYRNDLDDVLPEDAMTKERRLAAASTGRNAAFAVSDERWREMLDPSKRTDSARAENFIELPGYVAEGSWSPDGRYVLYSRLVDALTRDVDLFVYDALTGRHIELVAKQGYDGGPFFSPDGKWICYRSDREGNNLLQLFVSELEFSSEGVITGVKREIQITDNEHVNWAPFWYPGSRDGKGVLVYASSEVSHRNYEVFAIEFDADKPVGELRRTRITYADGFDGLPVFTPDGRQMLWTSQRGPMIEGEQRPSSQVWVADVPPGLFGDPDKLFAKPATAEASTR